MDLQSFERDAEALASALARERYVHDAGLSPTVDVSRVYDRFPEICSTDTYARLQDQPIDARQLRPLLDFATTSALGDRLKRLTDSLANAEAATAVEWLGSTLSFRSLPARIANEPDRDRRHALDDLLRAEHARSNPLRLERHRTVRSVAGELGFAGATALWSDLRGLHLADLSTIATSVLDATGELYEQALRDQLAHHKLDTGDVWVADLAWIVRGAEYDASFPPRGLLPSLYQSFAALGVRIEDQSSLRLDLAVRPLKAPRSFCAAVAVPDEVAVVVSPFGGRLDLCSLFEQTGRAEPLVLVDRTQPLAYRRLGDRAVARAYGLLFRQLTSDPAWLSWRLELEDVRDVARLAAFDELTRLRRSAAMLQYEQELYRAEEPEALSDRYAELVGTALGVVAFPELWLADVAEGIPAAQELRGAMLAGQLRTFLRREYDEEWFRSERAGRFLVDRWREGARYTAEELAQFMGFDGLDVAPGLEELRGAAVD